MIQRWVFISMLLIAHAQHKPPNDLTKGFKEFISFLQHKGCISKFMLQVQSNYRGAYGNHRFDNLFDFMKCKLYENWFDEVFKMQGIQSKVYVSSDNSLDTVVFSFEYIFTYV